MKLFARFFLILLLFAMLPVEVLLKILPVEERLKGLTEEEIEAYLKKLRKQRPKK